MKWVSVITLLVLTCSARAEDIFGAPEEVLGNRPEAPRLEKKADAAQQAGFVPNGNQATIVASMESAIAAIDAAMKEMARADDTAGHDAAGRTRELLAATLDHVRSSPFLPPIYPLALNKRGALFAVREVPMRAPGAGGQAMTVKIQAVSWFKVRVVEAGQDGTLRVDILDNTGAVQLYRAKLSGVENASLKPGITAQLVNTAFECFAEEADAAGTIYHLRKIPGETLLSPAK